MKDPCAQGRMWSWIAGHPEGNNAGVDTPYMPRWNHSKRLGQARGIRDPKYTVYMEGEAAPALTLLGPQMSPIPRKRMREKPGGVPRREIPTRRGIMVTWTQPTQKGRPKKDCGVDTPALSLLGPQKSPMR